MLARPRGDQFSEAFTVVRPGPTNPASAVLSNNRNESADQSTATGLDPDFVCGRLDSHGKAIGNYDQTVAPVHAPPPQARIQFVRKPMSPSGGLTTI